MFERRAQSTTRAEKGEVSSATLLASDIGNKRYHRTGVKVPPYDGRDQQQYTLASEALSPASQLTERFQTDTPQPERDILQTVPQNRAL